MAKNLVAWLLVAVIGLAFLLGLIVGLPGLQVVTIDTNTTAGRAHAWDGQGTFLGPDGVTDELCDATLYVTSWSPNLDSEKIVCRGILVRDEFTFAEVMEVRYSVFTSSSGLVWNERADSPYVFPRPPIGVELRPRVTLYGEPIIITLRGIYEGAIRVVWEAYMRGIALDGWYFMASDQAYLKSGIGSVTAPDQAQIGDTVTVSWTIPYITSELQGAKGWSLYGYSRAQNRIVLGPIELTQLRGSSTYKVTNYDFQNVADCRNELEWVLRNELWERDFKTTTVIDISGLGPAVTITNVLGVREAGKPVTVQFDVTPNAVTNSPITKVVVKWGFGGIENEVALTGTERNYTFIPGGGGIVHLEVIAYDGGCRPSPTAGIDIHIREPGQGPGTSVAPNYFVFFVVLIVFAVFAVLAIIFVPGPPAIKVLVAIGLFLVGVVVAIVLVPEVLLSSTTTIAGWR